MKETVGWIARHGTTKANEDNVFRSRMDPPLDTNGQKEAEKIARYAKKLDIKRILTSPMLRAVQTADTIADVTGADVIQDRGLISWNLGFLSGRDKDVYSPLLDFFIDNPNEPVPEGESLDDLEERVKEFFDSSLRMSGSLYVTHTSNIIALENLFHGNRDGRPETGEETVQPGGLAEITVDDGEYEINPLFGGQDAQFGE